MPVGMYNYKTGQLEQVDENEVAARYGSGQFGLPKGQKFRMYNPGGEIVDVTSETIGNAFGEGYRMQTQGEASEEAIRERYGDSWSSAMAATSTGLARGLTVGLSDVAIAKAGDVIGVDFAQELSLLKEHRPGLSIGAEVVGAAAPILLSGGAGAAGVAARVTPAAKLAKAGMAVETAVARAIAPAGSGLVRRIIAKQAGLLAGGALEGGVYEGGRLISESALGETELNADNMLSYVGTGALLGGAATSVFGSVGAMGKAGARKLKDRAIERLYQGATGDEPAKGLGKAMNWAIAKFAKASAMKKGGEVAAEDIQKLMALDASGKEARKFAVAGKEARDEAVLRAEKLINEQEVIHNAIEDHARGALKASHVQKNIKVGNESNVAASAEQILKQLDAQADEMIADPGAFSNWGVSKARGLKKWITSSRNRIAAAQAGRLEATAGRAGRRASTQNADIYVELDQLKRKLGKPAWKLGRRKARDPEFMEGVSALQRSYDDIRLHLEDVKLYGGAGEAQARVNAKWHDYLSGNIGLRGKANLMFQSSEDVWSADRGKIGRFIDNLVKVEGDQAFELLSRQVKARQALNKEIAVAYDLTPDLKNMVSRSELNNKSMSKLLDDVKSQIVLSNQLRKMGVGSGSGGVIGGIGGFMLGGVPGAFLGAGAVRAAMGLLDRPDYLIKGLHYLDGVNVNIHKRISGTVKGYVDRMAKGASRSKVPPARRLAAPAAVKILQNTSFTHKPPKETNRLDAYRARLSELRAIAADPVLAADRFAASTESLSGVAPHIARALGAKAIRIAVALYDAAPKPPPNRMPFSRVRDWIPDDVALANWERLVEFAEDPFMILDLLAERRLSPSLVAFGDEHMPATMAKIRSFVVEQIDESGNQVPYEDRRQLSIFLGIPLDETMEPTFIARMQDNYKQAEEEETEGKGPGGMRQTGLKDLKRSDEVKSRGERLAGELK